MNLRTEISLLGILTIETVLLTVYSSQPQRAFSSKSSLHNYRPLRFSRCSHAQQKVLLSSFSASDNVLVTYVLTVKRRGCQIFSTLRSGGSLAVGRFLGGAVNGTRPTNRQTQRETQEGLAPIQRALRLQKTRLSSSYEIVKRSPVLTICALESRGQKDIEVPIFSAINFHMPVNNLLLFSPVSLKS